MLSSQNQLTKNGVFASIYSGSFAVCKALQIMLSNLQNRPAVDRFIADRRNLAICKKFRRECTGTFGHNRSFKGERKNFPKSTVVKLLKAFGDSVA